jgi:hypothetical protein
MTYKQFKEMAEADEVTDDTILDIYIQGCEMPSDLKHKLYDNHYDVV